MTARWMAELTEFLVDTRLGDIPETVLADGRTSLMDTIGCMLGGTTARPVRRLASRLAIEGERCPVIGTAIRTSAARAALVGGVAATWLDLDSGHRHPASNPPVPAVHPPVHVVPVLLAVAPARRLSGSELLRIHLLAYELGARLGVATTLRQGLHVHGVQPTVAAAAAAALARGTDGARVQGAMELAASLCLAAPMGPALNGATVRNAYAGIGAANGMLADLLAALPIVPHHSAFEEIFGKTVSERFNPSVLLAGLGREWEATRGYYKVHACCRWNHPALDALEDIRANGPVVAADVERVEVDTFAFAAAMNEAAPRTDMGAKFSLPWAAAASLTFGTTGLAAFDDAALARPEARELAGRVLVREEPEFSAALPARRPTRVTLHLRDGRTRSATVEGSRGDPGARFPNGTLEAKFAELAGRALGPEHAARAAEALARIEDLEDRAELLALLTDGPDGAVAKPDDAGREATT